MFNPIKSVCVVYKSKSNKLYCPTVSLDCDILDYTGHTKYLGFTYITWMFKMMMICWDICVHCILVYILIFMLNYC